MASSQPVNGNLDFGDVLEFKMDATCFDDVMSTLKAKDAALDAQQAALDAQKTDVAAREAALDARENALQRHEDALHERERSLLARESGDSIVSPRGLTNTLLQAANEMFPVEVSRSEAASNVRAPSPNETAPVATAHVVPSLEAADALLALSGNPNASASVAQSGIRTTAPSLQVDIPEGSTHINSVPQSIQRPQLAAPLQREHVFVYVGDPVLSRINDNQPETVQTKEALEELATGELRVQYWKGMAVKAFEARDQDAATMALFKAIKNKAGLKLGQCSWSLGDSSGAGPDSPQRDEHERLKMALKRIQTDTAALGVAEGASADSSKDAAAGETDAGAERHRAEAGEEAGGEERVGGISILADAISSNISNLLGDDASDGSQEEAGPERG